jgi:RNA polymerase sigma factor (sigma-70 family)
MSENFTEQRFFDRLNQGDSSAFSELDRQYRAKLCRLVEKEMNRRFRKGKGPEDIVQSAFRTFYRRNAQGEFQIDSSAALWRLLETITIRKLSKHVKSLGTKKRNVEREEHPGGPESLGKEPTPDEAALAADLIEMVLEGLDESYAQLLGMLLKNCTEEEIAKALKTTRARVRGMLKRLRSRMERLLPPE